MNPRRWMAALVVLSALPACSCGSQTTTDEAQRSADQVLIDSATAMRSVHSFHMVGTISTSAGSGDVDLRVASATAFAGSITSSGVRVDIVVVNGVTYAHGRDFFLRTAGQSAAGTIGDSWARVPGSPLGDFGMVTDSGRIADRMLGCHGTITSAGTVTVGGRRAIELVDAGDLPGTTASTIDVALDGPPYPLHVVQRGNARGGAAPAACGSTSPAAQPSAAPPGSSTTITLSDFDRVGEVTPPPSALDLTTATP